MRLVNYLIWLNAHFQLHQRAKLARDTLMLAWWEQVLNGLLYELYFPDDLHPRGLHLFDLFTVSDLPQLDAIAERERLIRLRTEFERTYATDHPLRGALSTLHSLEIVRTIEGES